MQEDNKNGKMTADTHTIEEEKDAVSAGNDQNSEKEQNAKEPEAGAAEQAKPLSKKERKQAKKKAKKEKRTVIDEINSWVAMIVLLFVLAGLFRSYIAEPVRVRGSSMAETIHDGEFLVVSKWRAMTGDLRRGEIVICHYPNRVDWGFSIGSNLRVEQHTIFVKRLVALPGDAVAIVNGDLYINDKLVEEDYIQYKPRWDYPRRVLEEDEYFVIGDNRANSNDSRSRSVGPLKRNQILGHPKFVVFPLQNIRKVQ